MCEYIVCIEKVITTAHYVFAECADSAESIVYEYVLHGKSKHEILSNDYLENIEVIDSVLAVLQN